MVVNLLLFILQHDETYKLKIVFVIQAKGINRYKNIQWNLLTRNSFFSVYFSIYFKYQPEDDT